MANSVFETVSNNIETQLKNNIATYLSGVRADRPDGQVTTEIPVTYFFYNPAIAYKTPAVFIIADDSDYRLSKGQNHVNAIVRTYVSIVLEDRNQRLLTVKAWRYHDAFYKCLNGVAINTGSVQNIFKIVRANISSMQQKKMSGTDSVFRKEVMLTIDVEHYEKF